MKQVLPCHDGCKHLVKRCIPGTLHEDKLFKWRDPDVEYTTCELCPEKYHRWMEYYGLMAPWMLNAYNNPYECFNNCYEANEFTKSIHSMLDLMDNILNKTDKK